MSKSVRAQRSGAYLQEAVISIFVAGTMELSGSKSPIVAMAEAIFLFIFFKSVVLSPWSSYFYYSADFPLAVCVCSIKPRVWIGRLR